MTGSFANEQAYFAACIREGASRFVYLDPDGTSHDWLAVVVRRETGVIYGTQCAGIATEQRLVEGYLIPLGASKYEVNGSSIDIHAWNEIFHEDGWCKYRSAGRDLPPDRLARLSDLVQTIPYWQCNLDGHDTKHPLRIDESRIDELVEAWIPVETPDGPGVLLYRNCD